MAEKRKLHDRFTQDDLVALIKAVNSSPNFAEAEKKLNKDRDQAHFIDANRIRAKVANLKLKGVPFKSMDKVYASSVDYKSLITTAKESMK